MINVIYRPYIYINNINDFGLADIGNNIFFIPGVYFMLNYIKKKPFFGLVKDIYFHLLILLIIEFLSKNLKIIGTYDIKDVFALVLGAIITHIMVNKLIINKNT